MNLIKQLLLEYGASLSIKNNNKKNIMQYVKNDEYKLFLEACVARQKIILPAVKTGVKEAILQVIDDHLKTFFPLCSLRSR